MDYLREKKNGAPIGFGNGCVYQARSIPWCWQASFFSNKPEMIELMTPDS